MNDHLKNLEDIFGLVNAAALAVSGGVDSMLLAVIALNGGRKNFEVFHAVSPAVQRDGTKRVKNLQSGSNGLSVLSKLGSFKTRIILETPSTAVSIANIICTKCLGRLPKPLFSQALIMTTCRIFDRV